MIDAFATQSNYADHLAPVWLALPEEVRGTFFGTAQVARDHPFVTRNTPHGGSPVLVASYADSQSMRNRPRILIEHGAGQSYGACPDLAEHGSYSGGAGHDGTLLFLTPSGNVASRWRSRYPSAQAVVVGSPRLDRYHGRSFPRSRELIVCCSFHWDGSAWCPEAGSAFEDWREHLGAAQQALAAVDAVLVAHAHPRAAVEVAAEAQAAGVPFIARFDDVVEMADVYVADNSSTALEFASTGRPIIWLHASAYRGTVRHGGRFYDWRKAGPVVRPGDIAGLVRAVELCRVDPPWLASNRESVVSSVYDSLDGKATERAVEAILACLTLFCTPSLPTP